MDGDLFPPMEGREQGRLRQDDGLSTQYRDVFLAECG